MAGRLALAIRCPKCVLEYTKFINPSIILKRAITSSCPALAGGKYRKQHGKAADSLAYGPLTDLPDWTYLDGTLPPLSLRQVNRQKKRIETATRIVTLLKEINGAKEKSIKSKQGKSTKEQKTS